MAFVKGLDIINDISYLTVQGNLQALVEIHHTNKNNSFKRLLIEIELTNLIDVMKPPVNFLQLKESIIK